ncbi:MAG: Biopolymer transport protein ExbD/TolR [Bacteroidetes bacterium]|uniref:ExbD/TolR family protein n=1 Tax=unclassified Chitinophaga TaxID=2619133 RepID=UPI0009C9FB14|nr:MULTISPECIES: biopolymer transporter ExbD [unclassified Chitinophaga]MBP1650929.1 Biopolymer transport protein ExbD/TolR [Bacteroidota bacterium]OMP76063.1 biopolymer transporter ExbD [[Flexibacter] sp. ATCC 35208]WPV69345.1 biopolymer transporter ExbD [Chitinophaga sp. LS1]
MAEMDTSSSGGGKKHQGTKSKKHSTRVDMTPMVDLGFLLITFFMLTTTMSKPKTMDLIMPKDTKNEEEQNKVKESTALTILLGKDNRVYYYEGLAQDPSASANPDFFKATSFANKDGIRDVIIKKRDDVAKLRNAKGEPEDVVVIIKADDDAKYKNFVDILDEMAINRIQRYATVDISDQDKTWIHQTEAANGGGGGNQ